MGWYSAVGRPLFFALPPETAHQLAGAMLGLPLPWARVGHAVDDPALATTLAGLPLRNVSFREGDPAALHYEQLFDAVVGQLISKAR